MAESLIGTNMVPDQYRLWRVFASEAQAYHAGQPYPAFGFRGWRNEERGPLPLVMPFVQSIPRKAAQWLFGRPIDIRCENENFVKLLKDAWAESGMGSRMVAAAETGSVMGRVAVSFDYDETREGCPLRFRVIQPWMVRTFTDPQDASTVLMVRVTYPYRDYETGELMMYREDWTDKSHAVYEPVPVTAFYAWEAPEAQFKSIEGSDDDLRPGKTELKYTKKPNPFGVIPIVSIANIDRGRGYGVGDLWGMYRIVDRINLAYALQDRHNQKNVDPNTLLIDLQAAVDDSPQVRAPGEPTQLESVGDKGGEVKQLTTDAAIRPHIKAYAEDIMRMLLDAVGSVIINEEQVTNKGSLTQAVMTQMYAPIILSTEEKRKQYGENGLNLLFDKVAHGLNNLKVSNKEIAEATAGFNPDDPESYRCYIEWPDFFEPSDEDRQARVTRYQQEVSAGFMPREYAAKAIALMEGCEDIEDYLEDCEDPSTTAGEPPAQTPQPGAKKTGEGDNGNNRTEKATD